MYKWKSLRLLVGVVVAHPTGKGAGVEYQPVAAADIDKGLIDIRAPILHGVSLAGVGVTLPQAGALPELLKGFPSLAGVKYLTKRTGNIRLLT